MKYIAVEKIGYGQCNSHDIEYIINNVNKWCGSEFDLYIDGVKVDNPEEYLKENKSKLLEETKEENIMDTEKLNGVSCPGAQGEPGVPGFSPYETFQGRLLMEYTELVERIVLLEKAIESNGKIGDSEGLLERQLSTMKDYKAVLQLRIIDLLLKDKKEN